MGFLDVIIGKRKLAGPAPDRLFAISTAYVKFETELGDHARAATAAIVFQPLSTADFQSIVREMEEVVRATAADSGTPSRPPTTATASAGWCSAARSSTTWSSGSTPSAARSRRAATASACCARCSRSRTSRSDRCTGSTTTSAARSTRSCPRPATQQRDNERELVLKAQVGAELPVEQELERWFPLWGIPI